MTIPQDILHDLIGELKTLATTETIVGAPFSVGEFTVVPISRVSLGIGAGGGSGAKKGDTGEGGGGGGGIRISPVALLAVRGGELQVHPLGRVAAVSHSFEKVPELAEKALEKFLDSWMARKKKESE
ncbi:MAG: sporulation protein [Acidobacteria bacterium]|nr:sporulation protein [Acidobacteriota bacterium]